MQFVSRQSSIKYSLLLCFFASLCLSCSRRDDKYQEFADDKPQTSDSKPKETPKQITKDTASEKQIPKLKDPGVVISPLEASEYIGKFVAVRGYVAEVTKRERVAYLNFVERFPRNPFTGVIFAGKFDEFGDLDIYLHKEVEVSGLISTYKGGAQIILNDKSQIKIVK